MFADTTTDLNFPWLTTALLVTLCFTVACDDGSASEPPADLTAPGPYAVGYSQHMVTYQPVGVSGERTVAVEVWYPAVAGTGTPTTHAVAGIIELERPGVRTDGAPVPPEDLTDGGTFPVLAYSHGNRGVGLVAYSYGEHFASWGWVVVSPDHTGNTILDSDNPFLLSSLYRPQDLSAVLDWLEDGVPAPLAGRTDDRILAVGHSFGAYTVLSMAGAVSDWTPYDAQCSGVAPEDDDGTCALLADETSRAVLDAGFVDTRIDAVVPQAGSSRYAGGALAGLTIPALWMSARGDVTITWEAHGKPGWTLLDGPDDVWVDLLRGGHYSFLGLCDVVNPGLLDSLGLGVTTDGCGDDFTAIDDILPPVMAYTHAFGRQHVLNETGWDVVFSGTPLHVDVEVTRR